MIRRGLISTPRLTHDWVLGANSQIERGTPINPTKQWDTFLPIEILQKNNQGQDFYICVTASALNQIEAVIKAKFGETVVFSRRFTAKMSGTIPYQGNSKANVWNSILRDGLVLESDWPTDPAMTVDQFFAPIPASVKAKGLQCPWNVNYEYLPDSSINSISNALSFSPVQVSVDGEYAYNGSNEVIGNNPEVYTHEIIIEGFNTSLADHPFTVADSESLTIENFISTYPFADATICDVKKKPQIMLYKANNSPAIYCKHWSEDLLIPFADGSLIGADIFKSIYGITDYSQLPIHHVDTLPYPIASYSFKAV